MVQRRIRRQKAECGDHAPGIAKPNHPRRADAALDVAPEVHDVPADDNRAGGKSAHGDEVDGKVFGFEAVVDVHEDGEADDYEELAEEDVGHADAGEVGEEGEEEAEGEGGGDGGDGVELGLDGGVAEGFDDGGGEVGEGVDGDDDGCGGVSVVGGFSSGKDGRWLTEVDDACEEMFDIREE